MLVTKDGTLGRVAVADGRPACINQSLALLRPAGTRIVPEFLATVLRGPLYQERMTYEAGGSTIKHIYITRLSKMKIAYPTRVEQSEILASVRRNAGDVESALDAAQRQIDLVRAYRIRLITDVVTGKIDVREVAARLPDDVEETPLSEGPNTRLGGDGIEADIDDSTESVVA